jgi:hypothetical protein
MVIDEVAFLNGGVLGDHDRSRHRCGVDVN